MTDKIKFSIDGKEYLAEPSESIWDVAKKNNIDIPHLCYSPEPGYRADGNCRACMVEICLLYTSPSPRDATLSRMPSSA